MGWLKQKTAFCTTFIGLVFLVILRNIVKVVTYVDLESVHHMHNVPLVTEPFCKIAIDIVGPLPISKELDNRFILTVLDVAVL